MSDDAIPVRELIQQLIQQQEPRLSKTHGPTVPSTKSAKALYREHKSKLGEQTRKLLLTRHTPQDRSGAMMKIGHDCVEAGVPIDECFTLVASVPYNKFRGREDHDDQIWNCILAPGYSVQNGSGNSTGSLPGKVIDFPAKQRVLPRLENLFSLAYNPPPPADWLIDQWLTSEPLCMIGGEAKVHKSWTLTEALVALASGQPMFGEFKVARPMKPLLLDAEMTRRSLGYRWRRVCEARRVGRNKTIPKSPLLWPHRVDLTSDKFWDELQAVVKNEGIEFLAFDGLQFMAPGVNLNQQEQLTPILNMLTDVRNELNCGIIVVHHFGKQPTDPKSKSRRGGQKVLGSQAFHAWIEVGWWLNLMANGKIRVEREFREKEDPGHVDLDYLITTDEYEVHVDSQHVRTDTRDERDEAINERKKMAADEKMAIVLAYIEKRPQGGTVTDVCNDLGGGRDYNRKLLEGLVKKKSLKKMKGVPSGGNRPWVYLTR